MTEGIEFDRLGHLIRLDVQIIHDGLIGTGFLNRLVHTFDVPGGRLILDTP